MKKNLKKDFFRLQPRIDFPYYEISGPDICSLICEITGATYSNRNLGVFPSSKQFGDVPPGLNFLSREHGQSAKFICHGDHHEK